MGLLTLLADIFFAPSCFFCQAEGAHLCKECAGKFPATVKVHSESLYYLTYLDELWMRHAIHLLKYGGVTQVFDDFLAGSEGFSPGFCYIPVPLSFGRLKQRGYNQAAVLAQKIAHVWSGSFADGYLGKYERRSLVGLSKIERELQVKNQFYWKGKVLPEASGYVVVDDVLTTGSTLRACVALVMSQTKKPVKGLAIAHER